MTGKISALTIFAVATVSLLWAGCTCECEVECREGGSTYRNTTVKMRRSECESSTSGLNNPDVKNDSCSYRCRDR